MNFTANLQFIFDNGLQIVYEHRYLEHWVQSNQSGNNLKIVTQNTVTSSITL